MFQRFADVWPGLPIAESFTYRVPGSMIEAVRPGTIVRVPFRGKIEMAVVVREHGEEPSIKTEEISWAGPVVVNERQIDLAAWVSRQYFSGPGEAIFKMFPDPPARRGAQKNKKDQEFKTAHTLNAEQRAAFDAISSSRGQELARRIHLLEGITGSGKTEVYIHLIESVLRSGGCAMFIVPEISLTIQALARLRAAFGDEIALLHSGMRPAERWQSYESLLTGRRRITMGTRSAVFSPLAPDLIIIDEEHDGSYKEHSAPRYDARSVALEIAKREGSIVVLGSATPRLESRSAAQRHVLSSRATGADLSQVEIVPATESHLSPTLFAAMKEALSRKERVLLLLNRRGYFPYLYCKTCRKTIECPNCSVTLPLHRDGILKCHYCGYSRRDDGKCDRCASPVKRLGMGTQRMEEVLLGLFPEARVERIDTDSARGTAVQDCIARFLSGEIDILVGTQMIAKGLDSPDVTVVGVLKADQGLAMPDFRSAERTFALLTQVAGRAGRGAKQGRVFFEALDAEHPILELARHQDYEAFYSREIEDRREAEYPPFCRLIRLLVRSEDEARSEQEADRLHAMLEAVADSETKILGPAPAPIYRVNEQYRNHILIKTRDFERVHDRLAEILPEFRRTLKKGYLEIDVDPVDLL